MSEQEPSRLSVKPTMTHGDSGDLALPRPYLYLDGDETNAVINAGVKIGTKYGDPFLSFGLDLVIPPRLFWLVDPLYRREGRRLI